ncbi:MAG: GFA family protein [Gammaproteobacteria bacterium]
MKIEGSCYCQAVRYSVESYTLYPYMRCYCSFCRKTGGSGGYGINIMARADSLSIEGEQSLYYHHGMEHDPDTDALVENENRRYFCRHCGSPLWSADPRWGQWIYPFAGSVDTPLPKPPELVHIMLDFAAPWVEVPTGDGHRHFQRYPDESVQQWHERYGLLVD